MFHLNYRLCEGEGDGAGGSTGGTAGTGPAAAEPTPIPDALKAQYTSLEGFDSFEAMAKGYDAAASMIGSSIRIPGADAGDEDKQKFYDKLTSVEGIMRMPQGDDEAAWGQLFNSLGRPEAVEGYKLQPIAFEGAADFNKLQEQRLGEFTPVAHKLGLSQKQAEGVIEFQRSIMNQEAEQFQHLEVENKAILEKEFGQALPEIEKRGLAAIELLGGKDARSLMESGIGKHPVMMRLMATIADAMDESDDYDIDSVPNSGSITPADAQSAVDEIYNNKEHPYHDANKPGHQAAVQRMFELNQILAGAP